MLLLCCFSVNFQISHGSCKNFYTENRGATTLAAAFTDDFKPYPYAP